jgi:hypothetical protein
MGWWAARYRMEWPKNQEPRWYLDLLIARRVVSPVLARHRKEIALWRFHRRAGRDAAGHQFSFIFYSTPATAREVLAELRRSPDLWALKAGGLIVKELYSNPARNEQPEVGDTSDRSWAEVLQADWPYYIMGVSELWLRLVSDYADREGEKGGWEPLDRLEERYRRVSAEVDELWRSEGGHALLHHLSAIFGYKPLMVYERHLQSF